MYVTAIGSVIKECRERNGYSQRDLAEKCDLNVGTISRIENNKTRTSIEKLSVIAQHIDSKLIDIVTVEDVLKEALKSQTFLAIQKDNDYRVDQAFREVIPGDTVRIIQTWIPNKWDEPNSRVGERLELWATNITEALAPYEDSAPVKIKAMLLGSEALLAERIRHRNDMNSDFAFRLLDAKKRVVESATALCQLSEKCNVIVDVHFCQVWQPGPLYMFGERCAIFGFYDHRYTSNRVPVHEISIMSVLGQYFSDRFDALWKETETKPQGDTRQLVSKRPDWNHAHDQDNYYKSQLVSTFNEVISSLGFDGLWEDFNSELDEISSASLAAEKMGGTTTVVSIGKAAIPMLDSFLQRCNLAENVRGVTSTPYPGRAQTPSKFKSFVGGHPIPNDQSLNSAEHALTILSDSEPTDVVIFLVSGGASSAFELPAGANITLTDIQETYRVLADRCETIHETNLIRKQISAIKGGKLAAAAYPAKQFTFFVSDVEEGDLPSIASGPTIYVDKNHNCLVHEVIDRYRLTDHLPKSVIDVLSKPDAPLHSETETFKFSQWHCLASNQSALELAKTHCERLGWRAIIDTTFDRLSVNDAAKGLVKKIRQDTGPRPFCMISGGEPISNVKGNGKGGRNQAFLLELVSMIAGMQVAAISVGTDGIDGNSIAAGAVASGKTAQKATNLGLDQEHYFENSDSFHFFSTLSDSVISGPTLHNVRDLRILVAW